MNPHRILGKCNVGQTGYHPRIAVVVPVYNRIAMTQRFVRQYLAICRPEWRLVIINDGSTDGTTEFLAGNTNSITVINSKGNLWWAGATNLGVQWALSQNFDYVLTMNDDSVFESDFILQLLDTSEDYNRKAIIGSRLMWGDRQRHIWSIGAMCQWKDNRLWKMCHQDEEWNPSVHPTIPFPVDTLCGNGTLIPCAAFRQIGLYDAHNLPQYHADADWILRAAKHGWTVIVEPRSVIYNDPESSRPLRGFLHCLFSRKSPLFLPALVTILLRWCPPHRVIPLLIGQYAPVAFPFLRKKRLFYNDRQISNN